MVKIRLGSPDGAAESTLLRTHVSITGGSTIYPEISISAHIHGARPICVIFFDVVEGGEGGRGGPGVGILAPLSLEDAYVRLERYAICNITREVLACLRTRIFPDSVRFCIIPELGNSP